MHLQCLVDTKVIFARRRAGEEERGNVRIAFIHSLHLLLGKREPLSMWRRATNSFGAILQQSTYRVEKSRRQRPGSWLAVASALFGVFKTPEECRAPCKLAGVSTRPSCGCTMVPTVQ